MRCAERSEADVVKEQPNNRDVVTISFPYEITLHRGGYLRDDVYSVTIQIAFSRTLFVMMRNREIPESDILKVSYLKSKEALIEGLVSGSIDGDGWQEIIFASDQIDALMKIDSTKISPDRDQDQPGYHFKVDWQDLRRKGPMGFQL